jgi:hypothetical protein
MYISSTAESEVSQDGLIKIKCYNIDATRAEKCPGGIRRETHKKESGNRDEDQIAKGDVGE